MDQKKKLREMMTEIINQARSGNPDQVRAALVMLRAGLMRTVLAIDEYLKREDEHGKEEH